MKGKISVSVDESLLEFVDSMPGKTRSEKIERILLSFKKIEEELQLRKQLSRYHESNYERSEREIWEKTVAEAMWSE